MRFQLTMLSFWLIGQVVAQVEVQVNHTGNANYPNEPTICIDRQNPLNITVGANINNHYVSDDGGRTWSDSLFTSKYGVYGDPVLQSTSYGGITLLAHLAFNTEKSIKAKNYDFIDRIVVQRSKDGGKSFDDGNYAGLNGDRMQDKPWITVDESIFYGQTYLTWTEFDKLGSKRKKYKSRIRCAVSPNLGETWGTAITISDSTGDCVDDDHTLEGATTAVGADGEVYCAWAGHHKIWFDKSSDRGVTWGTDKVIAEQYAGWAMDVEHVYRTNGMPFLLSDLSHGKFHGRLYLVYGDRVGEDANIYLIHSDDKGSTWSKPAIVHQGSLGGGKEQYMPNMTIDQSDGTLAIVYYDRRNVINNAFSDVYMSVSRDGGETFQDVRLNSLITASHGAGTFSGDYIDIDMYQGQVAVVWASYDEYQKIFTRVGSLEEVMQEPNWLPNQFCFETVVEGNTMHMYMRTTQPLEIGYGYSKRIFPFGRRTVVKTVQVLCADDGTATNDVHQQWPMRARFDQALIVRNGDRIVFQRTEVNNKRK
ncbi:MAG: exo-alpha-sialidase [Bacteroidetes bacterium]|nr:exo-alpha-sialidase [Bacteroidota bacterium]